MEYNITFPRIFNDIPFNTILYSILRLNRNIISYFFLRSLYSPRRVTTSIHLEDVLTETDCRLPPIEIPIIFFVGPDNEPMIRHGKTATASILLRDALTETDCRLPPIDIPIIFLVGPDNEPMIRHGKKATASIRLRDVPQETHTQVYTQYTESALTQRQTVSLPAIDVLVAFW